MITYRDHVSAMTAIMRTIETDYLALAAKDTSREDFISLFMENMYLSIRKSTKYALSAWMVWRCCA